MDKQLSELSKPVAWVLHTRGGDVPTLDECYVANAEGMENIHSSPLYSQEYVSVLLQRIASQDDHINQQQDRIESLEKKNGDLGKALGSAEKRLATPVRVPDTLAGISENLRTQDNRITSEPMFCVYQKQEIVADAEYDHDRIVWVDEDGLEANEHQRMRLELLHDNCREAPAKWRRVAVKEIDEFVTCCFTEQGCKDYLACNGHNLRLPFIYVKSGFRNAEYIALRNWLMTNGFTVGDE